VSVARADLLNRLSSKWIEWIARNLLRGVPREELLAVLARRGHDPATSAEAVDSVAGDPVFAGALPAVKRLRTVEIVMNVKASLMHQAMASAGIERRSNLACEDFFRNYYAVNRPVVITDLVRQWPAYEKWTVDHLAEHYGHLEVEVQANRKSDPVYEVFLKGHSVKLSFADFLRQSSDASSANETYLTANDRVLENPAFAGLLDDFFPFENMFSAGHRARKQFLWIGAAGVVSPLHRDRLNVFMTQLKGRKKILMFDSSQTHLMYNFESFFSEVDAEQPDFDRYPDFRQARPLELVLEPGEALFIPVGWWHHIRALEFSINISMTNFARNNDFEAIYDRRAVSF
jgi:Cupin-like domain